MKTRVLSLLLACVLGLSLCACSGGGQMETSIAEDLFTQTIDKEDRSAQESDKIVITDQLGRTIEFDEPPQRLATTIMPFPYIFYAVMGNNDYMVGCNPSSVIAYEDSTLRHMYPTMAKVDTSWVDTSFVVNIEELLKLKPDVVFQWNYMTEEIEKMENAGLKVIALQYGTMDDLETWIRIISSLYQQEERGEELIDYFYAQVAEVSDRVATLNTSEFRSILQLSDNLKVAGQGFGYYLWDNSGAINPAGDLSGEELNVDMEQIYLWNPEIIYIGNFTDLQPSDLLENKLEGQDWSLVRAVKDGEVYKIPIGGYRWDPPGVETPLTIKWMAKIQHPELFGDMDMETELRDFYQEMYGFTLTDEMVAEILGDTQS